MNMKNLLCAVAVSMALAVPGYAAEPDTRSCAYWLSLNDYGQNMYLVGWMDAMETADRLTGDVIVPSMWPQGHRVGGVRIEVTVQCKRKRTDSIADVISAIAQVLNGVPIPEPQSSPYTRF
jgi:hypothetical protein